MSYAVELAQMGEGEIVGKWKVNWFWQLFSSSPEEKHSPLHRLEKDGVFHCLNIAGL